MTKRDESLASRPHEVAARRRMRGDDGAAIVEFGIIAPLLFLLVFGIIEFGWLFFQNLDVRHGAREGARLAAVNYSESNSGTGQRDTIVARTCERMDDADVTHVRIAFPGGDTDRGGDVEVEIARQYDPLTGLLNPFLGDIDDPLPSGGLHSTVVIRLEQDATYAATSGFQLCPA